MFDSEDDDDLIEVCRDETCDLDYVHPSHVFKLRPAPSNGRPKTPWWLQTDPSAYRRADPRGLSEAMRRAFAATDWPLAFIDIKHAVRNDYGDASVRSLHRHVRRLITTNFVLRLDLELSYSAYIRSDSKFLHDLDNLREHLMGRHAQFNELKRRSVKQVVAEAALARDNWRLRQDVGGYAAARAKRAARLASVEAP